jgi:hypothetical protein
MGSVQGPENMNDTCMKTTPVGIMGKGFTVLVLAVSFVTYAISFQKIFF